MVRETSVSVDSVSVDNVSVDSVSVDSVDESMNSFDDVDE